VTARSDHVPAHDPASRRAFILTNTRRLAPPLVPELTLHLAEESIPIWQKTEEELGAVNVPPPFWAFAWAGGQALARYLLDTPSLVRGKVVLDLGCGSGLTALAAARAGAARVRATDIDEFAVEATRLNAEINGLAVSADAADLLEGPPPPADVVLVGDLFYERILAERVLAFIGPVAARGGLVLIGDPQRSYFPRGRFAHVAGYEVPVTRELEDAEIKRTAVWRLG
jgi:predicted nicotinamide N-methyase